MLQVIEEPKMQSGDFVFWLQGFFELAPPGPISAEQAALIKAHLALVFQHDPSIPKAQMTHPVPADKTIVPGPTPSPVPSILDWQKALGGISNTRAVAIC